MRGASTNICYNKLLVYLLVMTCFCGNTLFAQSTISCSIDSLTFPTKKEYVNKDISEVSSKLFNAKIINYHIPDKKDTLVLWYKLDDSTFLESKFPLPLKSSYKTPLYLMVHFKDCDELTTVKVTLSRFKEKHINKPDDIIAFRTERLLYKLEEKFSDITEPLTEISNRIIDAPEKDALDERKESAQNKVVIDKSEFEKFGYFTAGEILRTLPGVYFKDPSENNLVSFRGAPSEYTQILIDGERLPDGDGNRAFQVDRIPASMIERIEVIRSPGAGQDAQGIAGTINIILKKSSHSPNHQISTSYGSNYTKGDVYQISGNSNFDNKNWLMQPKIAYQKRGNGKDKFKSEYSDIKNDKEETDYRELFYREFAFTPNLTYKISPNKRLTINPLLMFSEGEGLRSKTGMQQVFIPGSVSDSMFVNNREEEFAYRKRNTTAIRGNYRWKVDKRLELNAFGSLNYSLQDIDIRKTKLFEEDFYNTSDRMVDRVGDKEAFSRIGLTYTSTKFWVINGAVESSQKNRTIDRKKEINGWDLPVVKEELYSFREFRTNAFINNSLNLKNLRFNFGLRGELMKSENTVTTNYFTNFMLIEKPITKEGSSLNIDPYFNFNYNLNPDLLIKTIAKIVKPFYKSELDSLKNKLTRNLGDIRFKPNLTRAVKRPNFNDLNPFVEYRDGTWLNPDKGGNPNLQPETSWGVDLAIEYYPKDKKGVFGVNYYRRFITNMVAKGIDIDPWSERYIERPINIGNGTMQGFEFDFNYKLKTFKNYMLTTRGNLTLPKSAVKDPKTGESRSFKNQPNYFFNTGFDMSSAGKYKITVGVNYNHYPGFVRYNYKLDGTYQKIIQLPIYRIDTYLGFNPLKNLSCRLTAQNFIRSQKYKQNTKFYSDGTIEQTKNDREIFRPTYNVVLNYTF